jgi:hypothetical protein
VAQYEQTVKEADKAREKLMKAWKAEVMHSSS